MRELREAFYENEILPRQRLEVKKLSTWIPMSDEAYRWLLEDQEASRADVDRIIAAGKTAEFNREFFGEEVSMPRKKQAKKKTNKARKKGATKTAPAPIAMTSTPAEPPSTLTYAKGWDDGARRWKQLNDEALAGRQDRHDALEGVLELIAIAHRTGGIYTVANLIQKTKKVED